MRYVADLSESRAAVEQALNLDRIYAIVGAYPQISEVSSTMAASRAEVLAGYERIKRNQHLAEMCEVAEATVRRENARAIRALCDLIASSPSQPSRKEDA